MTADVLNATVATTPRTAWAAEQLGVSADASAVDARRQFQRLLVDAQFVPPDSWRAAFDETSGSRQRMNAPHETFIADLEPQLRAELDSFADRLFSLPLAERIAEYSQLNRKCADFPRLAMRLRSLAPCLNIDLDRVPQDFPLLRELAEKVARLAVLKPQDRAVARQTMIRDSIGNIQNVEIAARTLRATLPEIASLAQDLIEDLLDYRSMLGRINAARARMTAQQVKPKSQPATSGRKKGVFALAWLVTVVVLSIIGGMTSSNRSSKKYSAPPPDYWDARIEELRNLEKATGVKNGNFLPPTPATSPDFQPDNPITMSPPRDALKLPADDSVIQFPPDKPGDSVFQPDRQALQDRLRRLSDENFKRQFQGREGAEKQNLDP